jgi:hypothetical protein
MAEPVWLRSSSGRVHRAVLVDGQRLSNEQCNLDDADLMEIAPENFRSDGSVDWCARCFPESSAADPQPDSDAARDGADVPNPDAADDAGEEEY